MAEHRPTVSEERNYTNDQFKFYAPKDYYQELVKKISNTVAGNRIVLATMSFKPNEPQIQQIMEQLSAAARRGVKTSLIVDAYPFLTTSHARPGPLFYYKKLPERMPITFQASLDVLENFKRNGGYYSIINQPGRPMTRPFAGRCHIKLTVINDRVYIGGCNLADSNYIDMMLGWDDKPVADRLFGVTNGIIKSGNSQLVLGGKDLNLELAKGTELLIDSGIAKQSVIMNKALELIDQAQDSIFIACQFFPNSTTIKHLTQAHHRGVKVTIIYNHPSKHGIPNNILHHLVVLRERARTPGVLMKDQILKNLPFMHGKLIATEQGAILGSHNYVMAGVNFGTTEVALIRYDANFAKQAVSKLTDQLKAYKPE